MPPKVLTKNSDRAGGVLPVPAAARAVSTPKPPATRLKLEIRRLPPGLTLTEFEDILGSEWKLGNGKVDWREYRQGKMKNAMGKYPEQSRCYLHLIDQAAVKELEARFLAIEFNDKNGTYRSPELKHLPPTIGFALNQRTPLTAKSKSDARQGTIDQDAEFIAFLEAETQPLLKPAALDSANIEKEKVEKTEVKSTPLIEALREKKANKEKAKAAKEEKKEGKGHGRGESKDVKNAEKAGKDGKEGRLAKAQQKIEQASKEAVKVLNKHAASKEQQQQGAASAQGSTAKSGASAKSKKSAQSSKQSQSSTSTSPAQAVNGSTSGTATLSPSSTPQRAPRQRGNADGIKKMLQKDLGIKPKAATGAAKTTSQSPGTSQTSGASSKAQQQPPAAGAKASPGQDAQTAAPQAVAGTKAYLKHANPSQGMTEILIQQALSQYGEVANVTIDPRKGTAIALFKDSDGLKKAIEAKRVAVANGNLEVLAFRATSGGGGSSGAGGGGGGGRGGLKSGRGGGRGGRGGAQSASSTPVPAPTAKSEGA